MAIAITLLKRRQTAFGLVGLVQITPSSTYPTGGEACAFQSVVGYTNRKPDFVQIVGQAGFVYQYDKAGDKFMVYCNTAGGANTALGEHTGASYAAGVTGDTIYALCHWVATPQLPAIA